LSGQINYYLMYCHLLRVRAIPTLESTDYMTNLEILLLEVLQDRGQSLFVGSSCF